MKTKLQFSAGGIVYKRQKQEARSKKQDIFILVGKHSGHHGWVFPKGLIGDHIEGEGKEDTAVREVKEETGIEAKIEKSLTPVKYWYVWPRKAGSRGAGEREKINKTVYYFLMKYISGDVGDHDWEMEEVDWIDYNEVSKRLTYSSDRKVWSEAKELIASI